MIWNWPTCIICELWDYKALCIIFYFYSLSNINRLQYYWLLCHYLNGIFEKHDYFINRTIVGEGGRGYMLGISIITHNVKHDIMQVHT